MPACTDLADVGERKLSILLRAQYEGMLLLPSNLRVDDPGDANTPATSLLFIHRRPPRQAMPAMPEAMCGDGVILSMFPYLLPVYYLYDLVSGKPQAQRLTEVALGDDCCRRVGDGSSQLHQSQVALSTSRQKGADGIGFRVSDGAGFRAWDGMGFRV